METYSALRQFADSWWLLVMFVAFVAVVLFTFRPGSKRTHDDIAEIPLRDDDPDRLRDDAPRDRADDEDDDDDGPDRGRGGEGGPGPDRRHGGDGRAERRAPQEV